MGNTAGDVASAPPVQAASDAPRTGSAAAMDRDWLAAAGSTVGLILCAGTLALYSFGVFVRPLTAEFGWSRTGLFAALAFYNYGLAASSPVWGVLTDRYGPRRVILFSVVALSCLVASLSLLTGSLWHLYLVFAAVPLLGGGASPLGYSAVVTRLFDRHLGLALGLALMGVGLGGTVLPPLAQFLVGEFGWRIAYAALGLLTLVITFPAALVATRNVPGPVRRRDAAAPRIGAMLRTRAYLLMAVTFVLLGTVSVGMLAHLVPMMADHGVPPAEAARIAGLSGLAVVVGRGGLGWVLDRVHAPYVLAAVAAVAAVAPLLLGYGTGETTGYVAAVLVGFTVGAEVDLVSFLVRRYFDPAAFGRLYGIAFGLFILGSGNGPVLLGWSFDRLGGYRPGLLLFSALALVVAALAFAMPAYAALGRQHSSEAR